MTNTLFLATLFGIEYLIAYAIIAAISIGAGLLLRAKSQSNQAAQATDQPTNQSVRGGYIPLVMGRRRVGTCFLWTGDREEVQESMGLTGGGKGGGGGGDIKQLVYNERGWIGLCCGKAVAIYGIYKDGRPLANSKFAQPFAPSGSKIDFEKDGSAFIYWGSDHGDPALDGLGLLNVASGIASKWEGVCFLLFDRLRLGTVARWGNLEFDVRTCPPVDIPGFDTTKIIIPGIVDSSEDGWNPAVCIYILLTDISPLGCAVPRCRVDITSFVTAANTLYTEGLGANILFQDGQVGDAVVGAILEDIGAMLFEVDGRIGLKLIRTVASPIIIDDSVMQPPFEEIDRFHRAIQLDQVVFSYANIGREFAPDIVNLDDDGNSDFGTKRRQRKVALTIATNETVAWKIANRRVVEGFTPLAKYGIKFIRDFKTLNPGDVCRHPVLGDLRLIEIKFDANSADTNCLFIQDNYGAAPNYTDPDDGGTTTPVGAPLNDIIYQVLELSRIAYKLSGASDGLPQFLAFRVRGAPTVSKARIWFGIDPLELTAIQLTTKRQCGGWLTEAYRQTHNAIDREVGFTVNILSHYPVNYTDAQKVSYCQDIAASIPVGATNTFTSGNIYALIQNYVYIGSGAQTTTVSNSAEVVYVKTITAGVTQVIGGVTVVVQYKLSGIVRGRYDTMNQSHASGSTVIFYQKNLTGQTPASATRETALNGLNYFTRSTALNSNGIETPLISSPKSNITPLQLKLYSPQPSKWVLWGEALSSPKPLGDASEGTDPTWFGKTAFNNTGLWSINAVASHTNSYALKVIAIAPYVEILSAICVDFDYGHEGVVAKAAGVGNDSVGETELCKTKWVLKVKCSLYNIQTNLFDTITLKTIEVCNPASADLSGVGANQSRFIGKMSVKYTKTMHQADMQTISDYSNGGGTGDYINCASYRDRTAREAQRDPLNRFGTANTFVIGDVYTVQGGKGGLPNGTEIKCFYLELENSLVGVSPSIMQASRHYYSHTQGLKYRFGAQIQGTSNVDDSLHSGSSTLDTPPTITKNVPQDPYYIPPESI